MKHLEFEELSPYAYTVKLKNSGRMIGNLITENNGTFLFYPPDNSGGWDSQLLREIADKIDELDKPFYDSVDEYWKTKDKVDDEIYFISDEDINGY